ncbi:hypothetical protein BMW23_0829 [Bodo saltans virus]|uniref:Uncharacterized protein n=1 Tax=Bodo saltans virus TaxID=2024608 RepID=A0A2H4UVL8_9VIRU|nr:hypothetical protein QJ851_gp0812 [Bodo saltans virus]ATZ80875.1 hypothetical protein BMW23_0829 [Bodo saltans virus]
MSDRTITPDIIKNTIKMTVDFSNIDYTKRFIKETKHFNHSNNDILYKREYTFDSTVYKFGVNDIFENNANTNVIDIYKSIDNTVLTDIEFSNFEHAFNHIIKFDDSRNYYLKKLTSNPHNCFAIDIFVRNNDVSLHTIVIWYYNNNFIIIDPNNKTRIEYLQLLLSNAFPKYNFTIGYVMKNILYKAENPKILCEKNDIPRYGRTCDDVAIKICFIINETHFEMEDCEKLYNKIIEYSSNQSIITKMPKSMNSHTFREHLASDKNVRKDFYKTIKDKEHILVNKKNNDISKMTLDDIKKLQ